MLPDGFEEVKTTEAVVYLVPSSLISHEYFEPQNVIESVRRGGSRRVVEHRVQPHGMEAFEVIEKGLRPPGNSYAMFSRDPFEEVMVALDLRRRATYENGEFLYTFEEPLCVKVYPDGRKSIVYRLEKGQTTRKFARDGDDGSITGFVVREKYPDTGMDTPEELNLVRLFSDDFVRGILLYFEASSARFLNGLIDIGELCMAKAGYDDADTKHAFTVENHLVSKRGGKISIVRYDLECVHKTYEDTGLVTQKDLDTIKPIWERRFIDKKDLDGFVKKELRSKLGWLDFNRKMRLDPDRIWKRAWRDAAASLGEYY